MHRPNQQRSECQVPPACDCETGGRRSDCSRVPFGTLGIAAAVAFILGILAAMHDTAQGQTPVRTNQVAPGPRTMGRILDAQREQRPGPPPVFRPYPVTGPTIQPWPLPGYGYDGCRWHNRPNCRTCRTGYGDTTGSWLAIRNGQFSGGFSSGGFGIGSKPPTVCVPIGRWPYFSVRRAFGLAGYRWNGVRWTWYSGGPIDGTPGVQYGQGTQPAAPSTGQSEESASNVPATMPEEPDDLAKGMLALHEDSHEEAVASLREHLRTQPDDHRAMRVLALALIEGRNVEDAAGVMMLAYQRDPGLASIPLDMDEFGLDRSRQREVTDRAVAFAHRSGRPSAWVVVLALMQGNGRTEALASAIKRARAAGLESAIADQFQNAVP
ncbi:MAG: hypothetical protein SFZ23_05115 [Planctomycetota bacterium]|nr:hypothetical protein [Planctomycetota bacterium]